MLEFIKLQKRDCDYSSKFGYKLENLHDMIDDENIKIQIRELAEEIDNTFQKVFDDHEREIEAVRVY